MSRFFSYKKQTFFHLSKGKTNIYNKFIYSNDRKLFYQEKRYKQLFNSVQRSKKGGVFFNDWAPPKKSLFESWKLLALGTTPSPLFYQVHAKKIHLFKKKANHVKVITNRCVSIRKIRKRFWSPIRHCR